MPVGNGLLALTGIAEGLSKGFDAFRDERRYREDRDRRKEEKDAAADLALYSSLPEEQRVGSRLGQQLFDRISKRSAGLLTDKVGESAMPEPEATPTPGLGMPLKAAGMIPRMPDSSGGIAAPEPAQAAPKAEDPFGLLPGYKSKEERAIEKELKLYRAKKNIDREMEGGGGAGGKTTRAQYNKLPAETKNRVGIIADGLNSLDEYRKAYKGGQRERYVNIKTPLIGGLVTSSDIDIARDGLVEAIGRLESGGAISKDEGNSFRDMIPRAADKDAQAEKKLAKLERMLENRIAAYGISSLEDIGISRPGLLELEQEALETEPEAKASEAGAPLISLGNDPSLRPQPIDAVMPAMALQPGMLGAARQVPGLLKSAGPAASRLTKAVGPQILRALKLGGLVAGGKAIQKGLLKE